MPFSDREKHREWERSYNQQRRLDKPEYYLWKAAKRRAKAKGLDFDIEVSDIIIPQLCPLLNIPIVIQVGHKSRHPGAPSLDRIKNEYGYVKGNILVVSWRANFLKSDGSLEEFELLLANLRSIV